MSSITVNRGWLKKQIIAGNIEIKKSVILTDDYAADAANNFQRTETWAKADIKDFDVNDDFTLAGGRAWWNDERTEITWKLCANNYYKCRLLNK